jgi:hypothetical protein
VWSCCLLDSVLFSFNDLVQDVSLRTHKIHRYG